MNKYWSDDMIRYNCNVASTDTLVDSYNVKETWK